MPSHVRARTAHDFVRALRPLLLSTERQVGLNHRRRSQRPRRMKKPRSLMEMEKRQITLDAMPLPSLLTTLPNDTAGEMIDLAILFHGHCQFWAA